MKSVAMPTPPAMTHRKVSSDMAIIPSRDGRLCRLPDAVGGFDLFAICLLARLNRVVQGVLLAIDDVLTLFHNVRGNATRFFAKVSRLLLQEFLAFIGLVHQQVARFFAKTRVALPRTLWKRVRTSS